MTLVFESSKVTTASAFSRLTSALVTPPTLPNDLATEIAQSPQVIPDTESVTVLISANAAVVNAMLQQTASAMVSRFMDCLSKRLAGSGGATLRIAFILFAV